MKTSLSFFDKLLAFALASVVLLPVGALGESRLIEAQGDYSPTSVTLPPGFTDTVITFWTSSSGNSSHPVAIRLEAPQGTVMKAYGTQAKKDAATLLGTKNGWYPLKLGPAVNPRTGRQSMTIGGTASFRSVAAAPLSSSTSPQKAALSVCDSFTSADYELLRSYLQIISPAANWTNEAICAWVVNNYTPGGGVGEGSEDTPIGGGVAPPPGTGGGAVEVPNGVTPTTPARPDVRYVSANTLLHKDECTPGIRNYLIRVDVDLSGITAAARAAGTTLRFQLYNAKYKGRTASSMKPDSDGKFRGSPIILMSTLGWNENIDVVGWRKGMPSRTMRVRNDSADRAYWRGYLLARAPIKSVISSRSRLGRRANFELYTSSNGYGVCFALTGQRQRKNGYPK